MSRMLEQIRVGGAMVTSPRGVVPYGAADIQYDAFLSRLKLRDPNSVVGSLLRESLAASPDPRFQAFLELIGDKNGRGEPLSLATAAKQCQIGMPEFQAFWRDAQRSRALDEALEHIPSITKDMVEDAKSTETTCPVCDGVGQIDRKDNTAKICPNCGGKGVVRDVGDKHARDKILEMTGVIKKEPPVQVNLDMRGMGMQAAAARMQSAVPFDISAPSTDVIDAEPIDEQPKAQ